MIPEKILKNTLKRLWYIFPITCVVLLISKSNYTNCGILSPLMAVFISSALVTICANDEWVLSKTKGRLWQAVLISFMMFILIHVLFSWLVIDFWCGEYKSTTGAFFTDTLWNNIIITPIWMALLAIVIDLWISLIAKGHQFLIWCGWLLSVVSGYGIMKLMNETGLRDSTTIYTIGDIVEFLLVVVMAIGVIGSCLVVQKFKNRCPVAKTI